MAAVALAADGADLAEPLEAARAVRAELPGRAVARPTVQTDTQLWVVALQANGAQVWVAAGLQAPAPSQVRARLAIVVLAHAAGAHCIPAG